MALGLETVLVCSLSEVGVRHHERMVLMMMEVEGEGEFEGEGEDGEKDLFPAVEVQVQMVVVVVAVVVVVVVVGAAADSCDTRCTGLVGSNCGDAGMDRWEIRSSINVQWISLSKTHM